MSNKRRIVYANRPWEATGICSGCHLCELYCSLQHNGGFNLHRARLKVVDISTGVDIPVTCQQCETPSCQAACPSNAIVHDEKLGIVVVDQESCTGCGACVGACPYGIMVTDPATGTATKCDMCGGAEAACVSICPSHVLAASGDSEASEYRLRRFAALLAMDDEFRRNTPSGEDPTLKRLERMGVAER
jgi:anaerobic carbon-monoxide dehydrogenase iron sulfur subunit